MLIICLTLVLYYLISIVVGLVGLRTRTASRYITAPNSTGWVSVTLTLVATVVGGGMFLGISQLGFQQGLPAFTLGSSYLIGSIVLGLLAPTIRGFARDHNVTTLFGVIDVWYPQRPKWLPSLSMVLVIVSFWVFLLMLSAQFVAVGTYLNFYSTLSFSRSIIYGAAGVAVIATFLYAVIGGFTRDVITDVVQMLFIFLGVGIVLYSVFTGSFMAKMGQLPPELFYGQKGKKGDLIFFIGSLLFVAPTFLVRFDLWQRIITAKTDTQAKAAFFISGVLNFIFFAAFGTMGLYASVLSLKFADKI